jgi:hypothetical protein
MSLAYVGFGGVPMGRGLRERVAWYGDADLIPHLFAVLASGAIDVTVSWGEATAYDMSADRKAIARDAEKSVRRMTAAALRAGPSARVRPAHPATGRCPNPPEAHMGHGGCAACGFAACGPQCNPRLARSSHRISPCKFAISAAPACVFPPSASAATISASAPISKPRAR